jgi:starch phosphorylase
MADDKLVEEFLSLVDVERFTSHYSQEIAAGKFFGMPLESIVAAEKRLKRPDAPSIAYFSMEYGLATSFYNTFSLTLNADQHNKMPASTVFSNYRVADYFFDVNIDKRIDLPIYSGGLGVLAGDTIKTMADYKMPAVGIGILWHSGYFRQRFWYKDGQIPEKMHWHPYSFPGLIPLNNMVEIRLKYGTVYLKLWKYYVYSYKHDYAMPLVLLDAEISKNSEAIRKLTDQLYRSDNPWIKIMQRIVLGFGGIAALKELGYPIDIFHLNEGHAAFAFIAKGRGLAQGEIEKLKQGFAYTCHTPVAAGHDRFSQDDLRGALSEEDFNLLSRYGSERAGLINLTLFAMNTSSSINAVSKNHRRVMSIQFPEYKDRIRYITNGVHPYTWISPEFLAVFKNFPAVFENIEANPMALKRVEELKKNQQFRAELWQAHQSNKSRLCRMLEKWKLKEDVFTLCWARRIAAYKRPSLILYDLKRLVESAKTSGPFQIILAGKAHPNDNLGQTFITEMLDKIDSLISHYDYLKVVVLENYDIYLAQALTSGVDLWLNNPLPPFEASGTSGMKAMLNGVVQLTTLDGWVVEAEDMGIGRIFGYRGKQDTLGGELELHMSEDAQELYKCIEEMAQLYYAANRNGKVDYGCEWIDMMVQCIAAGAYFNTYRMLDEYKEYVWHIPSADN